MKKARSDVSTMTEEERAALSQYGDETLIRTRTFSPRRNGRPSRGTPTPDENQTTSREADEEREAIQQEASSGRSSSFATSDNAKADEQDASRFTVPAHWKRLDLADLGNWECEPLVPIVDGIIAQGNIAYVAAETQTGKTLLWVYTARMMIQGGELFGKFRITPVDKMLYLVLEDPGRRIEARLLDTDPEFPGPVERDRCIFYVAPGFRLDDDRMFSWLESVIVSEGRKFVVVDTYQKSTPGLSSFDDEKQSVILHKLADLTRRLQITLIVIDHVRKRPGTGRRAELSIDDIKGTGGKAQNADCVILMERTPDRKQIKFPAFSKGFDTPVRILRNVAPKGSKEPKFSYVADLAALGRSSHEEAEKRKQAVLDAMKPGEWMKASDIVSAAKVPERSIQRTLKNLSDAGRIDKADKGKNTRYCRSADSRHKNTAWRKPRKPNMPLQIFAPTGFAPRLKKRNPGKGGCCFWE
jgi:hypothetical protein